VGGVGSALKEPLQGRDLIGLGVWFARHCTSFLRQRSSTHARPRERRQGDRRAATGSSVDGVVVFAFLPRGGEERDWDLLTLFEEALGAEGAHCALQEMQEMMRGEQYGWSLRPVEFE
jgi:hypothetical protein